MTKISFVCPIYNKKKYLNNVLNSIKSQLGSFDKEYIFINDGSNDGSLEFIKEKTKNWKNTLILSQTNKGPSSATQKGILNSTGDYIKLVGGDDIMAPNCTKMLVDTIMKTKSIAVFSNYKLYNKTSDIHFVGNKVKNIKIIKKPLLSTIKSSFSGTTPNLYSNEFIKKAEEINKILEPVHHSMFVESNPSPVKYAAKLLGLCDDLVRLPLVKITDPTKDIVKKALVSAKLL